MDDKEQNKSIFIYMTSMHLGGAERALIGLLDALDYQRVSVDLFLNRHEGELMDLIPPEVNLLPEHPRYQSLAEPIRQTIRRGQIGVAICRTIGKTAARLHGKKNNAGISGDYSHRFTKWLMPQIRPETVYDLAISFITPHYFVAEKVRAKVKAAWIHTDYSQISLDLKSQRRMWAPYDKIVAVSESVAESFCNVFPELHERVEVVENILPEALIRRQAEGPAPEMADDGSIRLLSVGRFSYPKNFDNIPEICKLLVEKGLNVKWNIIGYGGTETEIQESIRRYGMEDHVVILGKRSNPYPYIKACDLYIQPSRYEGKAVTVREAQLLGKPVVITNYPTARSQLMDGVDGVIVPLDNGSCAEGIAKLLKDPQMLERLQSACVQTDHSNSDEIAKVYSMIG